MKLATLRMPGGATQAVRVDGEDLLAIDAVDVGALLAMPEWRDVAAAASKKAGSYPDATFATLVPHPSKVVCVGLNYRTHILEMGRDLPEYPTLFCKFEDTLLGATDDVLRPAETEQFDWECELTVVIGKEVRRATGAAAEEAIAGFTIMNDVTARDWQFRTREWLQGKNFDSTTPVGPVLVTADELDGGVRPSLDIATELDGEVMQSDNTGDLLFDPVALVEYVSTMIRLRPGDLIATGTPGGVGHARTPAVYMHAGQKLTTTIAGIGRLENTIVDDGTT